MKAHPGIAILLTLTLAACSSQPDLPPLPKLNLDPARSSVSGLSSGAYMAQQMHLAFSDRVIGAALFAGGPYGCAQGDLNTALASCVNPGAEAMFDLDTLAATVRERAGRGELAPLQGLDGDRVYVWHGSRDTTVSTEVSEASAALYQQLDVELVLLRRFDQPFAHLLPTAGEGGDCGTSAAPYLAACGFDAVGEALQWIYQLRAQVEESASGELRGFDASLYADKVPGDERGFVYVPAACAAGEVCGLHIAFHGCEQSMDKIGDRFVREAGYNRWADAAKLVVLYPQAQSSLMPLNPKACWDWWGYSGADYDQRSGAQLQWVAAMAAALGAPLQ